MARCLQTTDEDAKEREQKNERKLIYFQDQDDMWVIHAKLPPEAGALVVKAIEAVATPAQIEKQQQLQEPHKSVPAETFSDALQTAAPAVDAKTCIPHWRGEDCDYGMAIAALLQRDEPGCQRANSDWERERI